MMVNGVELCKWGVISGFRNAKDDFQPITLPVMGRFDKLHHGGCVNELPR